MKNAHRLTDTEAETLYNNHCLECDGYPTLTQEHFYGHTLGEVRGAMAEEIRGNEELRDILSETGFGPHYTEEAQGNNGW